MVFWRDVTSDAFRMNEQIPSSASQPDVQTPPPAQAPGAPVGETKETPDSFLKYLLIALGAVLLLAAIAGVTYWFMTREEEVIVEDDTDISETPSEDIKSESWLTYVNVEYKFELQYPDDWTFTDEEPYDVASRLGPSFWIEGCHTWEDRCPFFEVGVGGEYHENLEEYLDVYDFNCSPFTGECVDVNERYTVVDQRNTEVDGVPALMVEYSIDFGDNEPLWTAKAYYLNYDGQKYVLWFSETIGAGEDQLPSQDWQYIEAYDKIVESFSFVD